MPTPPIPNLKAHKNFIEAPFDYGITETTIISGYPKGIVTINNIVCLMGSLELRPSTNWAIGHVLFTVPNIAKPDNAYIQFIAPLIKSGGSYTDWIPAVIRVRTNGDVTLQRPLDAGTWYLYLNGHCYNVNQNYYGNYQSQ